MIGMVRKWPKHNPPLDPRATWVNTSRNGTVYQEMENSRPTWKWFPKRFHGGGCFVASIEWRYVGACKNRDAAHSALWRVLDPGKPYPRLELVESHQ